jgi:hypothetical protein
MPSMRNYLLTICVIASLTSCRLSRPPTRKVIFVPSGGVVRVGPEMTGYVYTYVSGEWVLSDSPVVLPEGWYASDLPSE